MALFGSGAIATVTGRVAKNVKTNKTGNTEVTNLTIRVSDKYKENDNSYFVGVSLWGKASELFNKFGKPGSLIQINGRVSKAGEKDGFEFKVTPDLSGLTFLDKQEDAVSATSHTPPEEYVTDDDDLNIPGA